MITTVLFDMGGTIEDIFSDDQHVNAAIRRVMDILATHGYPTSLDETAAKTAVLEGLERYAQYRTPTNRELKPEEIWGDYALRDFEVTSEQVAPFAEEIAHMWEVTHYTRTMRPGVVELLENLSAMGLRLGVISNTASLFQVYAMLDDYGIRKYFETVVLSSITGYRKPHANIFKVAFADMGVEPQQCAYVGDTLSRDVIGPRNAGIDITFQIKSFLTGSRDVDIPPDVRPTFAIDDIRQVYTHIKELDQAF